MKWAITMGYRPDNPAGDALGQTLGRQQTVSSSTCGRCPTGCLRHSLLIRQPICVRAATRTMPARLG